MSKIEYARRSNSQKWHRVASVENGRIKTNCKSGIIEEELVLSAKYGELLCPTCFPEFARPPVKTAPATPRRKVV